MRLAKSIRQDVRLAKSKWCDLNKPSLDSLVGALRRHRLSLAGGDLLLIDGRWYVTHSGLLRIAVRKHCQGMRVQAVKEFCDSACSRYAFRATVYTSPTCKGFVDMAMRTHQMSLRWSMAPRCEWRRPVRLTGHCAKPTALASARSRKSDPLPSLRIPPASRRSYRRKMRTGTTAALRSATGSAR